MPLTFKTFLSSPLNIFLEVFVRGPWEGTITRRQELILTQLLSAQPNGLLSAG